VGGVTTAYRECLGILPRADHGQRNAACLCESIELRPLAERARPGSVRLARRCDSAAPTWSRSRLFHRPHRSTPTIPLFGRTHRQRGHTPFEKAAHPGATPRLAVRAVAHAKARRAHCSGAQSRCSGCQQAHVRSRSADPESSRPAPRPPSARLSGDADADGVVVAVPGNAGATRACRGSGR
jgi:hypothetical protein